MTARNAKSSSITEHLETLELRVDRSPADPDLLTQLYHAYCRTGRFNEASQIQAMLYIPDSRTLEE
jgi:hypothetical protein